MLTAFLVHCSGFNPAGDALYRIELHQGAKRFLLHRVRRSRVNPSTHWKVSVPAKTFESLRKTRLGLHGLSSCTSPEPGPAERPRVTTYTSQRALLSSDKKAFTPTEFNDLLVRCNEPPRDERKILRCLKYSFSVVSARLLGQDKRLVAVVRSVSDGVMNATLWDVLVDPNLPNPALMRRNIVRRMLDDLSRDIPLCSVAMIAPDELVPFYEKECNFVTEPNGIRAMVLVRWPENLDELGPIELEDGSMV
jgi:hypothetical protein